MSDITAFTVSHHAAQRALDMGLSATEIRDCLEHPEHTQISLKYPDYTLYDRGRITCSVAADGAVATILWRTDEHWAADLVDGPPCPGREYRGR